MPHPLDPPPLEDESDLMETIDEFEETPPDFITHRDQDLKHVDLWAESKRWQERVDALVHTGNLTAAMAEKPPVRAISVPNETDNFYYKLFNSPDKKTPVVFRLIEDGTRLCDLCGHTDRLLTHMCVKCGCQSFDGTSTFPADILDQMLKNNSATRVHIERAAEAMRRRLREEYKATHEGKIPEPDSEDADRIDREVNKSKRDALADMRLTQIAALAQYRGDARVSVPLDDLKYLVTKVRQEFDKSASEAAAGINSALSSGDILKGRAWRCDRCEQITLIGHGFCRVCFVLEPAWNGGDCDAEDNNTSKAAIARAAAKRAKEKAKRKRRRQNTRKHSVRF